MGKKVIVGLSGGVDSSVAAYVLLQQGYDDWDCKKRIPFEDYEKELLFDFLHQIFHNDL